MPRFCLTLHLEEVGIRPHEQRPAALGISPHHLVWLGEPASAKGHRLSERGKRFLIIDWDRKYCEGFRGFLIDAGTNIVRLPHRSPNLNAYCERFVQSIKQECLDRMIFFSERLLRHVASSMWFIITKNGTIRV